MSLSPRILAEREDRLSQAVRKTLDPDVASVRRIRIDRSGKSAECTVELVSGLYNNREDLRRCIEANIRSGAKWVEEEGTEIQVRVENPRHPVYPPLIGVQADSPQIDKVPEALRRIGSVVAVSSCKGGVGKSTVSVNLAYALAKTGARVGILDADVYGPSLPTLVRLPEGSLPLVRENDSKLLKPAEFGGVKLMSYGYVAKGAAEGNPAAAVVRGPIVSQMIQQLSCGTKWGALDVLVVDLPPGTGDVVLTTCQTLAISAAVVVTTPQKLSYVDVVKGIEMFRSLKVPVASVVENMSHFDVKGERYYPFGRGFRDVLGREQGLENVPTFSLPIREHLSADLGVPVAHSSAETAERESVDEVADVFDATAAHLADWIVQRQRDATSAFERDDDVGTRQGKAGTSSIDRRVRVENADGSVSTASIFYDPRRASIVLRYLQGPKEGTEYVAPSIDLRLAGRDARTTSDESLSADTLPTSLHPKTIDVVGNYAVSIEWSDGHADGIYPFSLIADVSTRKANGNDGD
eukprot:g2366.t1